MQNIFKLIIMTPKQIAKKLLEDYVTLLTGNLHNEKDMILYAANCSIVAVNYLITTTKAKLWYDVRHEINKLINKEIKE